MADLLTPTLTGHRPRDWSGPDLPWRLPSQVYVAFLGGPVAVTIVAALNARRLRMPDGALVRIVAAGVLATLAGAAAAAFVPGDTAPRLFLQLAGVLVFGVLYLQQRSPDRVHATFSPHDDAADDYASLWGTGIAAVVAGWVVQLPLVAALEELA